MKTYIINLASSTDRKTRMDGLMKNSCFPEHEFIEAVDGRKMDEQELDRKFDRKRFRKLYTRDVRPGEIGCTLSHQKCYRKIVEENEKCALILEDDIVIAKAPDKGLMEMIERYMDSETPRIMLLSGGYWFTGMKNLDATEYRLAEVYDAFMTHSYVINRAAAKAMTEDYPYVLADNWFLFRKKCGVELTGLCPHLIDQDWSGLGSVINKGYARDERPQKSWYVRNIGRLMMRKLLKASNRYENEK